ncbi:hypothetical protein [Streptomyces sp. G1]|uniref:hypothetical protein n=1 Tax=Streptomyces sp. G1 TaxID=361572 RepID=UPI00202EE138|nr:hypothetical protein [Streptomyces sp. G1]MCM1976449.1 hypothetical protein [Streptomyces sp. G1]
MHLRKAGTGTPAATVTSFEPRKDDTPCTPSCQEDPGVTGVQSAPLRLADLGRYTVDVEYTGTVGEPIRYKDKATLTYDLIPRVTSLEVVGKPHFDNRTVTVKADAVGRDPRNDTDQPLANGELVVETNAVTAPVVTDAAGHVEAPFTFAGSEQIMATGVREIMVTLRPESEAVGSGLGRSLMVGTLPPPKSKITMDAAKLRGPDASTVPASGRLTFQSADGTWKPAPAGTGVRGRIEGRGGG